MPHHVKAGEVKKGEPLCYKGSWNGWHLSTIFCICHITLYTCLSAVVCRSVHSDPKALILGGVPFPFQQCWLVQMAFSTALFLNFICWLWTVDKDKARLFYLVVVINGIPVLSYGLLASGLAPILIDVNGRRLIVIRYMQWLFTTPAMIYLYSLLSSVRTPEVVWSMANGVVVILTGYLANVLPAPFDLIALAASFLAFYVVMQTLDRTIAIAVAEFSSNDDESYCRALKAAKLLTTFSWVGVPVVWTLAYYGLISHAAEEISYELFDFIIKSGVSCIIMHSSLKTHAEKKEERMRAELAEERGTIKALRETARMKVNATRRLQDTALLPVKAETLLPLHPFSRTLNPTGRKISLQPCRTSCARHSLALSASPTASSPAGPSRLLALRSRRIRIRHLAAY
jgi:sensory rhodopsin